MGGLLIWRTKRAGADGVLGSNLRRKCKTNEEKETQLVFIEQREKSRCLEERTTEGMPQSDQKRTSPMKKALHEQGTFMLQCGT